jgi:vancomycin resistance protein YoaR
MDKELEGEPHEERGEIEYKPQWPQRPPSAGQSARSGLDPAGSPRAGGGEVPAWTAHPTSHDLRADGAPNSDPNATNQLPVVDRSRFDIGRQPQQPVARVERPAPRPQPQMPTPTPTFRGQPPSPQAPRVRSEMDQTQVRQPSSWEGYGSSDEETLRYTPIQRPHPSQVQGPKSKVQSHNVRNLKVEGRPLETAANPRYIGGDLAALTRGKKRRGLWVLWMLAGVLAIAVIAVVAFTLAWQGQYAGKIYAGVNVLGTDLGGKTKDEARKLLLGKVQEFIAQPVVLTWRNKEWRPTAEQLGLKVDVDNTVDEAMKVGRTPDMFGSVGQQWTAAQGGYVVPLSVQMSEPVLQTYLSDTVASEINQQLFEGDVRLDGTRVVARPGVEGISLQVYPAIVAIRDALVKLEAGKVDLPVDVAQPVVSAEEVGYVESLLALRVSAPITATAWPGKSFSLDPQAIIRFTTIERNSDPDADRHVQLGWKEKELQGLGEAWATEARRPPQNARFAWGGGAVSVLSESIDGFETDPATVVASIKEHTSTSDARVYDLPGKVITPTVSSKDLPALGIKELIGTGTSTFVGSSQERATNIKVAANLLNGAVVPPGGTFSFLDAMGGIDETHGFVEGYVIAAERTTRGVGGGVCQVSTTAFRAAFWSGLEIDERNQHSYRVSWYEADGAPVGFDAAVFDPGVDLKFKNTTPGYILVEAVAGDALLKVNIYGTKPPGEIKLEGPVKSKQIPPPPDVYEVDSRLAPGTKKQVETARPGLDVTITRRIIVPGQEDKVDQFHSSYQAWPNWYVVSSCSQTPKGCGGTDTPAKPTPNP